MTNNTTGDVGIAMQDVTGNFVAATGLSGGTLQHGKNLLYTLNNGTQQLVSQSNTITSASSSITGLSVTALQANKSVTMSVTSDTSAVSSAIQQFVTDYNTVQSFISAQQVVTTSSSGTVTPGTLTADQTANQLVSNLRSLMSKAVPGLSGVVSMLSDLGIQSNGKDNTLAVDTDTLNNAVADNPSSVNTLFNDPTNGIATQMNNFLTNTIGANGTVTDHQASLTEQSDNITTQISNLESKISTDETQWTTQFQAMEQAESHTNQELTYLSEQVTNGSA